MAQYEVAILYHPDLEVDLSKAEDRVKNIIEGAGGKVGDAGNWGKRKLAYPIKKQEHAVYVFYTVDMPAEGVAKVEAALNITDEVIRYLVVKPDIKGMAKAEVLKKQKEKRAAERGEKPSEEETETDEE